MNTTPAPSLLNINGVKFAPSASALVDTMFNPSGTASGIYSKRKGGILLSGPTGEPFAFIVLNGKDCPFAVSCSRQADGRIRYMHALTSVDEKRLNLSGMGYGDECRAVSAAVAGIVPEYRPLL